MDIRDYNRTAWNELVKKGNRWTKPVSSEEINKARQGDWQIVLTPVKPIPDEWFPPLANLPTLCLASGGGQQGPILAAAGANVTVFDNSTEQLAQDKFVADRDGLTITTMEGDMADLSTFADDTFGLIVHPCSNCFVPDVRPVWRECYRVLQPGGVLLVGFTNGVRFIFDDERQLNGSLEVCHPLPYSDLTHLTDEDRQRLITDKKSPLEFGHTLTDQIGGQLDAGFVLTDFYEDRYDPEVVDPLSQYLDTFIATRAVKVRAEHLK